MIKSFSKWKRERNEMQFIELSQQQDNNTEIMSEKIQ